MADNTYISVINNVKSFPVAFVAKSPVHVLGLVACDGYNFFTTGEDPAAGVARVKALSPFAGADPHGVIWLHRGDVDTLMARMVRPVE